MTGLFLHAYEVSKTAVDFYATVMLRQLCPPKVSVLATGLQFIAFFQGIHSRVFFSKLHIIHFPIVMIVSPKTLKNLIAI